MGWEVKKLTKDLAADFFDFFDDRAFSDHAEWSGCYCTWFHATKDDEARIGARCKNEGADLAAELRAWAETLIQDGVLNGFLAYSSSADGSSADGDKKRKRVVGFANANRKTAYAREKLELKTKLFGDGDEDVLAVTCFTIDPEYRLKGVATALLGAVCEYAKEAGFKRVEGYPAGGEYTPFDFEGPVKLYGKFGFVKIKDGDNAVYKEV